MGDWADNGDWAENGDWAGLGADTNRMGGTGAIRKPPRYS